MSHESGMWPPVSWSARFRHNTAVHDAQFSPNGQWLVTAALRASLWDVTEEENVLRLKGHEGTATRSHSTLPGARS